MANAENSNSERDLRRLTKRFGITIQSASNTHHWPAAHQQTFQSILKIGDEKFDSFSASIDIRSTEEPWREATKSRAEYLAKRASELFNQERNESGWRLALESLIFYRFSVEVACPKCRARLWRSENEARVKEGNNFAANLKDRRENRMHCICPPSERPRDYHEAGTNLLFEDRTQELIIHDPLLRSQLPKQEPDRVFGLRETTNFERLLSTSVPDTTESDSNGTLRELVRSCPFKSGAEPLLFPFMALEAKSGKSPSGFYEIQMQTAFPIFALLKLQEDLAAQVSDSSATEQPLVWFFANRGDAWRVYGCCISDSQPTRYDIFQLWDGSIVSKDSSLQLLHIVDYIFDWARDIYRPSILSQLKSTVTGSAFDQVTLSNDSDIFSMRRNISNWVLAAPSTINELDLEQEQLEFNDGPTLNHQDLLSIPIPNSQLGTVRSAALIESRIEGLYVTEQNVVRLLELGGGEEAARQFTNFLVKWNELLVLTEDDIDDLEGRWKGHSSITTEDTIPSDSPEFYVLTETKIYMNTSWTVVRELTYVAVSKAAFEIIFNYANFKNRNTFKQQVANVARSCSKKILNETFRCLSGSPSQYFQAATTCVCVSWYALPERKRSDHAPPIEALAFGRLSRPRLPEFIQKFHKIARRRGTPKFRIPPRQLYQIPPDQRNDWIDKFRAQRTPKSTDLSFIRNSEAVTLIHEKDYHEATHCGRCVLAGAYEQDPHHFAESTPDIFSAYGFDLAICLNTMGVDSDKHDICLFGHTGVLEVAGKEALTVMLEDLLRSGYGHHTIRHPFTPQIEGKLVYKHDTLWNLPLSYRRLTPKEKIDIGDWIHELKNEPLSQPTRYRNIQFRWDGLQMLLHYLKKGDSWAKAVTEIQSKDRSKGYAIRDYELYKHIDKRNDPILKVAGEIVNLRPLRPLGPFPEYTRGDVYST
ncbi:hypothetical protein GLAREA_06477 [Glarea lozoyensis ATCC 20868]|uniref:Uncharacterized protein n=1 Tax=Glarea lozoyensis (strain ATCC 20868 / MF5171) TaxID=1116229 RepID=S3D8I1_GLAL2|nr:uncharacterized protein GLAREA_06477 [Glarea lozoyensis ATCC 20868]EPE33464.1 hypothetical protein GLAREA_06477 [Glarea lozoyensis ATCC 20868]